MIVPQELHATISAVGSEGTVSLDLEVSLPQIRTSFPVSSVEFRGVVSAPLEAVIGTSATTLLSTVVGLVRCFGLTFDFPLFAASLDELVVVTKIPYLCFKIRELYPLLLGLVL